MAAGSTGGDIMVPDIDVFAVLGALPAEVLPEYIDIWLSMALLLPGVIVMFELRTVLPGADIEFDRNVIASLPSCVAVPSLRS